MREWLIGELGPKPRETVLELGAGTGETGFAAAAILGEGGRLISTDEREVLRARLSEAFVAFAANGGYELPGAALCAVAS